MNSSIITNVFPFSLVRRKMIVTPVDMNEIITIAQTGKFESAWGHANTIHAVKKVLGVDITPRDVRPAVMLDREKFPMLHGHTCKTIFLISPDFIPGFRPAIGEEVAAENILGWSALMLNFDLE